MAQLTMYPGQVNSPATELATQIDDTQDTIQVLDASILPDAPNIATIGVGENAETILYTSKDNATNELTGVTRGFQGKAKIWNVGIKVRRLFTAYDWDSIRQNFESHLADIAINVKDFGGVGDGASDDSIPIQSAIDFVYSNGGGTVFIPNGIWLVKKTILLPSNIHLKGAGVGTVIKGDFGSFVDPVIIGIKNCDTAVEYSAAKNIIISDFSIDSNTNGIGLSHAQNIVVRNIYGKYIWWHYVDIAGCQNVLCENLFLGEANAAPFQIDNLSSPNGLKIYDGTMEIEARIDDTSSDNITLSNTYIEPLNNLYGVHLHRNGGQNITIKNCTIKGAMYGVYQDENTSWSNIVIDNVTFINQASRAVWFRYRKKLSPSEYNSNLKIVNCHMYGFGYQGIVIDGWNHVTINNVTMDGAFTASTGAPTSISIYDSNFVLISNVQIIGSVLADYGIRIVEANSVKVSIVNSIIKNVDTGLFVGYNAEASWAGLFFTEVTTPQTVSSSGKINAFSVSTTLT